MTLSRRAFLTASAALILAPKQPSARAAAPGGWRSHGFDLSQTRHNAAERVLTASTVARLEPRWALETGSGVTGTPAVVGEHVVVGSWDGKVYAADRRSGATRWTFDAGTRRYPPNRTLGVYASPAIAGSTVVVACDRLLALDLRGGKLRWERTIGDPATSLEYFWAPPLVHDGAVYAGVSAGSETHTRGRIVRVSLETGEVEWTFFTVAEDVAGGALVASPSYDPADGTLWVATGNPFHVRPGPMAHSCSVLALDARTSEIRWAEQVHAHDTQNLDLNCPPLLLDVVDPKGRPRRLVVVGGKDGVRAWDRDRRELLWHVQLTPPLPAGGREALATTGPEAGPIAAAEGLVFFASNNHDDGGCLLAALEAASGRMRWLRPLPAFQHAPLSVAGGVVYLGLGDGTLRAWRAHDGELLWEHEAGDPIAGGPAIAGGMLFVGTGAGEFLPGRKLLAFALPEDA